MIFKTLTRFIFDSNKCKGNKVRYNALLPFISKNGKYETSVFGCHGLEKEKIWDMNERTDSSLKGRGDFPKDVLGKDELKKLFFEISEPPENHGNICGWPDEDEKFVRVQLAKELALKCKFFSYE